MRAVLSAGSPASQSDDFHAVLTQHLQVAGRAILHHHYRAVDAAVDQAEAGDSPEATAARRAPVRFDLPPQFVEKAAEPRPSQGSLGWWLASCSQPAREASPESRPRGRSPEGRPPARQDTRGGAHHPTRSFALNLDWTSVESSRAMDTSHHFSSLRSDGVDSMYARSYAAVDSGFSHAHAQQLAATEQRKSTAQSVEIFQGGPSGTMDEMQLPSQSKGPSTDSRMLLNKMMRSERDDGQPPESEEDNNSVLEAHFVVREHWAARDGGARGSVHALQRLCSNRDLGVSKHVELGSMRWGDGFLRQMMIHPDSKFKLWWSMMTLTLLCYDSVMLPMDAGFQLPTQGFFEAIDVVSLCVWVCDFLLNFISGVHRDGIVHMSPQVVAVMYLRGFLVLDVILIASDVIAIVLPSGKEIEALAMLRVVRFLRLLRILRVARFSRMITDLLLLLPDPILLRIGVMKMILYLTALVHVMACMWYGIGNSTNGWVRILDIEDESLSVKYSASLHLSVSQLHGSTLLEFKSTIELLMSAACGLLGFLVLASCLSKIAVELDASEEKRSLAMHRVCRHYMASRNVSSDLAIRLRKFTGENGFGNSTQADVRKMSLRDRSELEEQMIGELPLVLQIDLLFEVREPMLKPLQLFRNLHISDDGVPVLREICYKVTKVQVARQRETLFSMGEACNAMLVVDTGRLVYANGVLKGQGAESALQRQESPPDSQALSPSSRRCSVFSATSSAGSSFEGSGAFETPLSHGDLLCEAVLWTHWEHCGELCAAGDCSLLSIDSNMFAKVICGYETYRRTAGKYALCMVAWMNSLEDNRAFCDLLSSPPGILDAAVNRAAINPKEHYIFISHFKEEAGTEATLLEEGFERLIRADPWHPANDLRRPVFLDSQDLSDLSSLQRSVRRSHNLLLLLTPKVLTRPWCLLEILTAQQYGLEIVPVLVDRPGLSFEFPKESFFDRLAKGEGLQKSDVELLTRKGVQLKKLNQIKQVFQKIALRFSPHKSGNIREAELQEVLKRCCTKDALASGAATERPA